MPTQTYSKAHERNLEERSMTRQQELSSWMDSAWQTSGLPESYKDLFYANPYYDKTAKGGFLGFGRAKAQAQIDLERDKYIANLQQKAYDEAYNSPVQAAARERAAGINPDLSGLGDSGSAATPSIAPQSGIEFPDSLAQASDIANLLLNFASLGFSIPQMVSNNNAMKLDNEGRMIENAAALEELVFPHTQDYEAVDSSSSGDENELSPAVKTASRAVILANSLFPGNKKEFTNLRKKAERIYNANRNTAASQLLGLENLNTKNVLQANLSEDAVNALKLYKKHELESIKNRLWLEERMSEFYATHKDEYLKTLDDELKARDSTAQTTLDLNNEAAMKASFYSKYFYERDASALAGADEAADIVRQYEKRQREIDLKTINELQDEMEGLMDETWSSDIYNTVFHPKKRKMQKARARKYEEARKRQGVRGSSVYKRGKDILEIVE